MRYITISFLTSLLCSPTSAFCVQQAWIAKYTSGPGSTNPPVAIALDNVGNIYVGATSTQTNAPYDLDYIILKYSSAGTRLWANRFGTAGANDTARAMVTSTNGDVFVTGTAGTVKYHASGLLAWTASYAGSDIKTDASGNTYVTGFRTDAYSIVKIGPDGTNIWLRLWDPSQWVDISQKIALDNVGNVFVSGLVTFNCDQSQCYFRPWTVKYDPSGSLVWSLLLYQGYHTFHSEYKGTICDTQGNLYLAISLRNAVTGDAYPWANRQILSNGDYGWAIQLNTDRYAPGVMAMTMGVDRAIYYTGIAHGRYPPITDGSYETHKVTGDGTNVWTARYAPASGVHQANAIVVDLGGNAYVTRQSPGNGTGNDYATIKYGTNGQQLWVKRYTEAGNSDDQAHAIAVAPNGDVYVTGFSNPSPGTYEITTIKYVQIAPIERKSNGNILLSFCGAPGSNYVIEACTTLTNWTNIATTTAGLGGLYTFEDTNAPSFPQRFYRTKQE